MPRSALQPATPIESLWSRFRREVHVCIQDSLYMLDGVHRHHRRLTRMADRPPIDALDYPELRRRPVLPSESWVDRTAPGGPIEDRIFRALILDIFRLWEEDYRGALKSAFLPGAPDAIQPSADILGDLRLIRNDLAHPRSLTASGGVARCKTLRWFKEGERMRVRWWHVLDFLNRMGWLGDSTWQAVGRQLVPGAYAIPRPASIAPPLASAYPFIEPDQPDPRYRYCASVAFEDGVVAQLPMGPETEEEAEQSPGFKQWLKMEVSDDRRRLIMPGLGDLGGSELYAHIVGNPVTKGPGTPGPPIRFRR